MLLVGFNHVVSGCIGIFVGLEEFLPDDIQLLPLIVHHRPCFLDYAVHVEQGSGNIVDLVVSLLHYFVLELIGEAEGFLPVVLAVAALGFGGRFGVFVVGEAVPGRPVLVGLAGAVVANGLKIGSYVIAGVDGGDVDILLHLLVEFCIDEKIFSAIFLDSELLFDCANFTGGVGVEVGLLQFIDEVVYFRDVGVDEGFLSFEAERDIGVGFNADGSIEVVVAVFELFDEGDGLFVGLVELSSHLIIYMFGGCDADHHI